MSKKGQTGDQGKEETQRHTGSCYDGLAKFSTQQKNTHLPFKGLDKGSGISEIVK